MTELVNMETELVNTMTEIVNVETEIANTMTEIVNMETELVNTMTEIVNVETEIANTITEIVTTNKNVFDFIKEPEKLQILIKVNELLHINNSRNKRLVFVYSAPKVGSTSIVSSLRIFGLEKIDIIHIHDEEMLEVLGPIKGITINELILFNKYLGSDVYVINIYRSPLERKISSFFEKIGSYHFNTTDQNVNKYNVEKVINRFNNIFPYIETSDHFIDKYNITIPECFNYQQKYLLVKENDITYISLRLKDSVYWGTILTNIFGFNIRIVKDYESTNKPIKDIYNLFKKNYKIPINFLDEIINCKYLKYYYSSDELKEYYNEWNLKSTSLKNSYTQDQYRVYQEITLENTCFDKIQLDHYMDEGCGCKACSLKRLEISSKIMRGIYVNAKIIHNEAKTELIQKRVERANKINEAIRNIPQQVRGKDFQREMTNVVKGKRI